MIRRTAAFVITILIRAYQIVLRPLMPGGACRFFPSCSEYAIAAVERYGPLRGGWMGLRRIARCHPFACGGIDPVPREDHGPIHRV